MPNPSAPGVYVTMSSAAPSPNTATRTGTWFVTGECEEGPVGVAIPITSMADFASYLGNRPGYTVLYDALDEFFHDGGTLAYVSRVVGSAAATNAAVILKDSSTVNTLTITANGAGVWGNSVTVTVAAGTVSNTYTLSITDPTTGRTWTSGNLTSPADAVTWAQELAGSTPWAFPFTIVNDGSTTAAPGNNPATGTFDLTGGADDLSGIAETDWTAALTAFSSDLGPGQVSAPGHTTQAGWEALVAHASATDPTSGALLNNRFALLDDQDSASASTVVSQVAEAQAGAGDPSFAMLLAPWVVIPGLPPATVGAVPQAVTRTVPPSALVAALMAANDASNSPDQPAAGPRNGASSYATGVTQSYSEADRGTLNNAGVSVIRQMQGVVTLYGYRTIATNPSWVSAAFARERMYLVDALNTAGQPFMFQTIDGQGHLLSAFAGALSGVLQDEWQRGALFGATPADAFQVNVGSSVNTAASIAAGQLNATVAVRFSPYAEFTEIKVVQYPVTASLPS